MGEQPSGATSGVRSVLGCEDWGVPVTAGLPPRRERPRRRTKERGVLEWPPGQRNATGRAIQARTGDPSSGKRRRSTSLQRLAIRSPGGVRDSRKRSVGESRGPRLKGASRCRKCHPRQALGTLHVAGEARRDPCSHPRYRKSTFFPPLACLEESLRLKLLCRLETTDWRPSRRPRCGSAELSPRCRALPKTCRPRLEPSLSY